MKRATVEGRRNPRGRNGLTMGLSVKWLNWWKKMLEQRCSYFNLRHFVWCQYHWLWQFTTLSLQIHLQGLSRRRILHRRICAENGVCTEQSNGPTLLLISAALMTLVSSPSSPTCLAWLKGKKVKKNKGFGDGINVGFAVEGEICQKAHLIKYYLWSFYLYF